MSRMKSITTLFPMVTLAVLGLSLPQDASAFGGGGSIKFTFGTTVVCDTGGVFSGPTGTTFAGTWTADPGSVDPYVLATVTQDMKAVTCYDEADSNDKGVFDLHIVWSIPPTAAGDGSGASDNDGSPSGGNNGHGNSNGCDPSNPSTDCAGTLFPSGVTCTDDTINGGSILSYLAVCGNDPATATGYLTLNPTVPSPTGPVAQEAPAFTGCTDAQVALETCTDQLGGEPLTKNKKSVNESLCPFFFPFQSVGNVSMQEKWMMVYKEHWEGQCVDNRPEESHVEPVADSAAGVVCHSDAFDNTARGCVVDSDNNAVAGQGAIEEFGIAIAEGQFEVTPNTINLQCSGDKDEGVVTARLCGSATFDVSRIDPAKIYLEGTPVKPGGVNISVLTTGLCSGDLYPDLETKHYTCQLDGNGVAQNIVANHASDPDPLEDGDTVTLTYDAQTFGGTALRATSDNRVNQVP